jgi:hypothetical protein
MISVAGAVTIDVTAVALATAAAPALPNDPAT